LVGLVTYVDFVISLLEYVFDDSNPFLFSYPAVIVELISGLCEGSATRDESFNGGFEAAVWHIGVTDYGSAELVENLVECAESRVVPPAVDVGCLDVENLLAKALGDELRDTRLPGPAGSGDDGGVRWFTVRDWFEDAREVIDLGVPMLDFSRDKAGAEDASIADHSGLSEFSLPSYKSVTGSFPGTTNFVS